MKQRFADEILSSRLLVLQSKRLMLNSVQRRFEETGLESFRKRSEKLRVESELAAHVYRRSMLELGSPETMNYWTVAYGRLIERGHLLTRRLRDAAVQLPVTERYELSADVEMLEEIIGGWTESLRRSMAASSA